MPADVGCLEGKQQRSVHVTHARDPCIFSCALQAGQQLWFHVVAKDYCADSRTFMKYLTPAVPVPQDEKRFILRFSQK